MKLMIDANILLDVLQNREPHVQASSVIWKLCETAVRADSEKVNIVKNDFHGKWNHIIMPK